MPTGCDQIVGAGVSGNCRSLSKQIINRAGANKRRLIARNVEIKLGNMRVSLGWKWSVESKAGGVQAVANVEVVGRILGGRIPQSRDC